MTQLHHIYVLKDELDKIFYVGKSVNPTKRFKRHLANVKYGWSYPIHNKLRKVLLSCKPESVFEIIESNIDESDIDKREIFYIKYFKEKGCKLKNLTEGGDGGKFTSSETIEKIRRLHFGKKRSVLTKKRISESKLGVKFSREHKDSLKKAWEKREPLSKEHYQKISKLNRGRINIKRFSVQSPTGEIFVTENGLTDFCRNNNLSTQNLHKTLTGKRPTHKGWKIVAECS